MKRKIITALTILILFILQSSVFSRLDFGGIVPNLMIILTASYGFMRGEKSGIVIGFFCGLLTDIFFGDLLGAYALIYMYVGYFNGKFSYIFFPEDINLPITLIAVSDIFYGLICYVFLFMMRGRFNFPYYFLHIIIPEMIYTIVVTIVFYPIILKVNKILDHDERRSAKKFA